MADKPGRNATLDLLRGLAIVLMIGDHVASMVLGQYQGDSLLRLAGRMAEPLFTVLFGYFLVGRSRSDVLARCRDLLIASVVVIPVFWGVFGRFDILASFLLVFLTYLAIGRHLSWLLPLLFLFSWDPTFRWPGHPEVRILDYPLFLVTSQVACGMLIRHRFGWMGGVLVAFGALVVPSSAAITSVLTLPAALLVWFGVRHPTLSYAPLVAMGRRPLLWYAAHIPVVALIGFVAGRCGGARFVEILIVKRYLHWFG